MTPDAARADVCIANIGPRQRRKRARLGLLSFAAAALLTALLCALGAAREWRVLAAAPIWFGAYLFVQAREST